MFHLETHDQSAIGRSSRPRRVETEVWSKAFLASDIEVTIALNSHCQMLKMAVCECECIGGVSPTKS